jgi:hypothetical protein
MTVKLPAPRYTCTQQPTNRSMQNAFADMWMQGYIAKKLGVKKIGSLKIVVRLWPFGVTMAMC